MFKPLKELLDMQFLPADWHTTLLSKWPVIMGGLGEKTRLESIKQSTLIVGVYDISWIQELHLLAPVIIKTINDYLGNTYIKQIRFKHASKKKLSFKKKSYVPILETPPPVSLSTSEQRALQTIKDTELQKTLRVFLFRCYQQRSLWHQK